MQVATCQSRNEIQSSWQSISIIRLQSHLLWSSKPVYSSRPQHLSLFCFVYLPCLYSVSLTGIFNSPPHDQLLLPTPSRLSACNPKLTSLLLEPEMCPKVQELSVQSLAGGAVWGKGVKPLDGVSLALPCSLLPDPLAVSCPHPKTPPGLQLRYTEIS